RVRRGPVGRAPERQLRETLLRHCGVDDVVLVPDDQPAYDAALASGRALSEVAPRSRARAAMLGFAQDVVVDRAA
ncbi:MAG TPA: chromosome partitioning protein, partial [Candidatus Limnocylindria bacterium]|nr:chromosome partitioning protein [Candidatus Limnocylindria bacterium]